MITRDTFDSILEFLKIQINKKNIKQIFSIIFVLDKPS